MIGLVATAGSRGDGHNGWSWMVSHRPGLFIEAYGDTDATRDPMAMASCDRTAGRGGNSEAADMAGG